jgi:hypothetical protein
MKESEILQHSAAEGRGGKLVSAEAILPKLGRPREAWLNPTGETELDHARFGAAMAECQDGSGSCASTGICSFGECFAPDGVGYQLARKAILAAIGAEHDGSARAWLQTALAAIAREYHGGTGRGAPCSEKAD